ncbi:MAG TPA: tetratricopeptide repeat protein [Candidatus Polarisedimenticolia bacterium]|nr:tetratricopeptide repeat protein [Candidatus Polarisedimenticolia bacterium]
MTRRLILLVLLVLAPAAILAAGLRRVPEGETFLVRSWAWGGRPATLEPGWTLAPPLLSRVARFPAGPREVTVRTGLAGSRLLRSREGAGLMAAGRLTVSCDPSRAGRLAAAFPRGWDSGVPARIAEALRPALAAVAARGSFVDLMGRTGSAAVALPPEAGAVLDQLGLSAGEGSALRFYPAGVAADGGREGEAGRAPGRRVLLIGLDGADWDLIDPLLREGRMPNLERLVSRGVRARLKTISPVLSPIIWTSIATGVGPDRHGIVDFFATSRTTGSQIPVTSNMRRVKALWNILSERGRSSGVVAWWASWPAEPVDGFMVSDRVAYQLFGYQGQGDDLRRRAYPEALGLVLQPLVMGAGEVADDEVRRFFSPEAEGVAGMEEHVRRIKENIASARTYLGIGLDLLSAYDPDFKAIYFQGTDTVAHNFMRYRPPAMAGVTPREVEVLGPVVDRYYEWQDEMLGEVLKLADERTLVLICSDHGFRTGANRPPTDPRIEMGGAADWHRKFGVLIASGAGARQGAVIEDASVLDITPTVLAAMGLPPASDMAGSVISGIFERPPSLDPVASYETGDRGQGSDEPIASALDEEIRARLTALGYVSQEGSNALNNTGITLLDGGRYSEAADAFRRALAREPRFLTARINLGRALMLMKDYDGAVAALEEVLEADPAQTEVYTLLGNILMERGDLAEAERRFREGLARRPGDANAHNSLGLLYDRMGKDDLAIAEYEKVVSVDRDYAEGYNNIGLIHRKRGEPRRAIELFAQAVRADPDFPGSYNNMGLAHQDLGELAAARAAFERGLKVDPDNAVILNNLGTIDLAERKLDDARRRFEEAIRADPDYPSPYNNLGAVLGMTGHGEESFEQYLRAVELDPAYTDARFNLARSFLLDNRRAEAIDMLEKVLEIDPGYGKARLQLGILMAQGGDLEAAGRHAAEALRRMPDSPDAHNLMADVYLNTGRSAEARRELERSLELDGSQPRVREMLDRLR